MHALGGREVQSNLRRADGLGRGVAGELAGAPALEAGGEDLGDLVQALGGGEIIDAEWPIRVARIRQSMVVHAHYLPVRSRRCGNSSTGGGQRAPSLSSNCHDRYTA